MFAWSCLYHPTPYLDQEPSIYSKLWNTNKQHMSVSIFPSTSYSQSQASPKKRHLCASSAVKKVCVHMHMMQRIFTEVSSSLLLLVKEHQYSHRFKTVVCHCSDIVVIGLAMSLKTACFCVNICVWTQNTYHLCLLLHDYPAAKLLKTR